MKWQIGVALTLVLQAACGSASQPRAAASPPPSASPAPTSPADKQQFAVLAGGTQGGLTLAIVGTDGAIYGQTTARSRSGSFGFQPSVSTSNDAVYFLDGDSAVMRLVPGGTAEHVRDLPGTSNVHAVFAVSPDDSRIAVAVLTYDGPTYQGMQLYVENLNGSHHVDIYSSSTVAEWPVGWRGSDLVIAVGLPQQPQGLTRDPLPYYAYGGIHVADAATGNRKATLCSPDGVLGLATPYGLLCAGPTYVLESDWTGNLTHTNLQCASAQLQPLAIEIACAPLGTSPYLWDGGVIVHPLPAVPACWLGSRELILDSKATGPLLYHVGSGKTQQIAALVAWCVGVIPGGLG